MEFDFNETFDELNLGSINGQSSWVANAETIVQNSVVYAGSKALELPLPFQQAYKITSLFTSGALSFAFRAASASGVATCQVVNYIDGSNGINIAFIDGDIFATDILLNVAVNLGTPYTANEWFLINVEFDIALGDYGQFRVKVNNGEWSSWLNAGGGTKPSFAGSNIIWLRNHFATNKVYFDEIITVKSSPDRTSRKNYSGYLAFIQQYIRHKIAGTDPWANPDGTLI